VVPNAADHLKSTTTNYELNFEVKIEEIEQFISDA